MNQFIKNVLASGTVVVTLSTTFMGIMPQSASAFEITNDSVAGTQYSIDDVAEGDIGYQLKPGQLGKERSQKSGVRSQESESMGASSYEPHRYADTEDTPDGQSIGFEVRILRAS